MLTVEREIPGFVPTYDRPILPGWRIVGVDLGTEFRVVRVGGGMRRHPKTGSVVFDEWRGLLLGGGIAGPRWYRWSDVEASVNSGRFLVYRPRRRGEVPEREGRTLDQSTKDAARMVGEFPLVKESIFVPATPETMQLAHTAITETLNEQDRMELEFSKVKAAHKSEMEVLNGRLKANRLYVSERGGYEVVEAHLQVAKGMAYLIHPETGEEIHKRKATSDDRNLFSSVGR